MTKDFYRRLTETTRIAAKAAEGMRATGELAAMLELMIQRAERRYSAAIKAIGGDPGAAVWNDWTLADLEDAAALTKRLGARYGAQVTVTPGAMDGNRRGRRTVMTKEKFEMLTQLLRKKGATLANIAARLEVSQSSVYRAMKQHNLKFS